MNLYKVERQECLKHGRMSYIITAHSDTHAMIELKIHLNKSAGLPQDNWLCEKLIQEDKKIFVLD
jgi:hypothetical protein